MTSTPCEVCHIQAQMDAGGDPWAVARLSTGYVRLHTVQYFRGYTFFSARACVHELYQLGGPERAAFLHDMAEVASALHRAFTPHKLNYELLGNTVPHLHWHLVPRHLGEPDLHSPIWEDHHFLRLVWSGREADPVEGRELAARLMAELLVADVTIDQRFA
jgi:diadenosine tetraphosphate (Ap4A) HIT family hydrolase